MCRSPKRPVVLLHGTHVNMTLNWNARSVLDDAGDVAGELLAGQLAVRGHALHQRRDHLPHEVGISATSPLGQRPTTDHVGHPVIVAEEVYSSITVPSSGTSTPASRSFADSGDDGSSTGLVLFRCV